MNSNFFKIGSAIVAVAVGSSLITAKLCNRQSSMVGSTIASKKHTLDTSQSESAFLYPADTAKADIYTAMADYNYVLNQDTTNLTKSQKASAQIEAYTISATDLLSALGIPADTLNCTYHKARVYIGYHPNNTSFPLGFKLFVVPVHDTSGIDMFFDVNGNIGNYDATHKYVMDLNTPCPNFCDKTSYLYVAVPQ